MKPRSQDLAQRAYAQVERHLKRDEAAKKKYGALAHKLPVLILQHGLAHATGFVLAKDGGKSDHHGQLLDDLAKLLDQADGKQLHQQVLQADLADTMRLTRRALEASGWIKRYVQGLLKVDSTGHTSDESDTANHTQEAQA